MAEEAAWQKKVSQIGWDYIQELEEDLADAKSALRTLMEDNASLKHQVASQAREIEYWKRKRDDALAEVNRLKLLPEIEIISPMKTLPTATFGPSS